VDSKKAPFPLNPRKDFKIPSQRSRPFPPPCRVKIKIVGIGLVVDHDIDVVKKARHHAI